MAGHDLRPGVIPCASVARTHPGMRRMVNEDRVYANPHDGLWAVADGMGGHDDGAAAAQSIVTALASLPRQKSGFTRLTALRTALETVNTALIRRQGLGGPVSGSTVVALLVHDDHFACVWAGDSRAYLLRSGVLQRLTRDHSVVQDLVDCGVIADHDRARHPQANLVTRAVGATEALDLDHVYARAEPGDVFLLCSDGLTGCVSEAVITGLLRGSAPEEAAETLLSEALKAGAADNVSLIVVAMESR